jgi:hypothetical protein
MKVMQEAGSALSPQIHTHYKEIIFKHSKKKNKKYLNQSMTPCKQYGRLDISYSILVIMMTTQYINQ